MMTTMATMTTLITIMPAKAGKMLVVFSFMKII